MSDLHLSALDDVCERFVTGKIDELALEAELKKLIVEPDERENWIDALNAQRRERAEDNGRFGVGA